MIEIKNLTRRYGSYLAVDGLSLKLNNGRIYGLLGPNGAGKSTTMNMLTGCLEPSEGCVRINGFDVFDEPLKAKKCIGYLPEQPPLYEEMTPFEYLRFVADAKGISYERGLRQIHEVMELTCVDTVKDRLIQNLSKGTRQRVGIAQALIGNPDIVVLDEPTVGLDPKQITEIRALIRRLGELKKTVIVSSHILAEIEELCDHVIILAEGRVVANAPIDELKAQTAQRLRLKLSVRGDAAGVANALLAIKEIEDCCVDDQNASGVVELSITADAREDLRDRIFFALAEKRYAVLSMESTSETLESIFLSLTEKSERIASQRKKGGALPERDGEYELIDEEEC